MVCKVQYIVFCLFSFFLTRPHLLNKAKFFFGAQLATSLGMTVVPRSMPMLSRRSKAAAVASVALLAAFSSPCAFATPKSLKETGMVCAVTAWRIISGHGYVVNNHEW